MAKREKSIRTYQDYSDDDVEILGITQGRGAPEFRSPPRRQGPLRYLRQYSLQEVTGITTGAIAMQGDGDSPFPF